MQKVTCSAVLLDMDGVLVDSTAAVARVWNGWARQHGLEPDAVVKMAHGRPSISTIRELVPHADHAAEDREVERREIADVDGIVALPGAMEIVQALPPDRYAIVTSATRALAEVRLRAAKFAIPAVSVTATSVTRGKPNPDPYLVAAQLVGAKPASCVVIEDAPSGVRAGKSAGARVIAVRTTANEEELLAAGADWIVGDLSDILAGRNPPNDGIILRL